LIARVELGCTVGTHDTGEVEDRTGVGDQLGERLRILERTLYPVHRSFGDPTRRFRITHENAGFDARRAQSLDQVRTDKAGSPSDGDRPAERI
jgi:hypothetical protein